MPNNNRSFMTIIENYIDMAINAVAFFVGYVFVVLLGKTILDIQDPITLVILFGNVLMLSFVYNLLNVYRPMRYMGLFRSFPEILKVNLIYFGGMALITSISARTGYKEFVLYWMVFSFIASTAFLTFKRHFIKVVLRTLRERQFNLRKVIVIGDNTNTAAAYIKEVTSNTSYGIMVMGYVGDKLDPDLMQVEKLGAFYELESILDKYHPTDVIFAIDAYDKRRLIKLVNMCDDRCIKVFFLPVIYGFFKSSRQIEQYGRIPLINIHSTPIDNVANAALKRAMDVVGSLLLIILTAPVMIFAAIGVKISSPGPVFFKQQRVGKLGRRFTMLKFRSMYVNKDSTKAWTTGTDPRKTRFGTFLRRTAIDELPQLFNVLYGSMSLVGPRPEIPKFVDHFRDRVPLYMIKHYVKPGVTGLAQIRGLRGDTSIEERIHADIDYIENWSILLDFYILFKTPFKAFNKNEQYVPQQKEPDPVELLNIEIEAAKKAEEERNAIKAQEPVKQDEVISQQPEEKNEAPSVEKTAEKAKEAPETELEAEPEEKNEAPSAEKNAEEAKKEPEAELEAKPEEKNVEAADADSAVKAKEEKSNE